MSISDVGTFLATVDPNTATVVSFPQYISVFGGKISTRSGRSKPISQRDAFMRWVAANRADLKEFILLPENYDDWNDFNIYSDLLLFEKDLSYLTSAILIFLESPGSIAELGAFSQIDSLSQRVVIVVTADRHPAKSFISLGPIRSINDTKKNRFAVCGIPHLDTPSEITPHIPVVVDMLAQKRKLFGAKVAFDKKHEQHQILLILELVNLLLVSTTSDLRKIAAHFGIPLKHKRLNQILFVLKNTHLISERLYGGTPYFCPKSFRKAYVDFNSKDLATPFNRLRATAEVVEKIKRDPLRKHVYEAARREWR